MSSEDEEFILGEDDVHDGDYCDPQADPSFEEDDIAGMTRTTLVSKLRRRGMRDKGSMEVLRRDLHRSVLAFFNRRRVKLHNDTWFQDMQTEPKEEPKEQPRLQEGESETASAQKKRQKRVSFSGSHFAEEVALGPVPSSAD